MAYDAFQQAAMWPTDPEDRWMLRNPPDHRPVTMRDRAQVWKDLPPEQQTTFADMLDVVNPLQHIPLVNIAYRELTGDELSPPGRILGGMLYGGPMGMVRGAIEAGFEMETGRDFGATAVAMLNGEELGRQTTPGGVLAEAMPAAAPATGPVAGPAAAAASVTVGPAPTDTGAAVAASGPGVAAEASSTTSSALAAWLEEDF